MKIIVITTITLIALLTGAALLPFIGPKLGLANYQAVIEPAGIQIEISSGTINVRDHPHSGRDVILVHGHPGSAQMMQPLASALHRLGYRIVRYDRMGWGHSSQRPLDQPANPVAHAADLLELTQALTLENPIFVGYSYGGGVVMEANLQAPDTVKDIVLISSIGKRRAPTGTPSLTGRIINSPLFKRWAFGTDYTMNIATRAVTGQVMHPEIALPGTLEGFMASLSLPGVPTHWHRETDERYLGFSDYQPEKVRGCVLLLHGAEDRVIPVETANYLADRITQSSLQVLAQAGHGMVIAQPDRLAESISKHDKFCHAV